MLNNTDLCRIIEAFTISLETSSKGHAKVMDIENADDKVKFNVVYDPFSFDVPDKPSDILYASLDGEKLVITDRDGSPYITDEIPGGRLRLEYGWSETGRLFIGDLEDAYSMMSEIKKDMDKLLAFWQSARAVPEMDNDFENVMEDCYPFEKSFDSVVCSFGEWCEQVRAKLGK